MLKIWRRYTRFQSSVRRGRDTDEPPAMKWKDLPQLDQWDEWCTGKKPEETRSGQKWWRLGHVHRITSHIPSSFPCSRCFQCSLLLSFTLFISLLLCSLSVHSLHSLHSLCTSLPLSSLHRVRTIADPSVQSRQPRTNGDCSPYVASDGVVCAALQGTELVVQATMLHLCFDHD